MCKGDFKEAHQRQINLPDDDPIDIGILAEYLYMHNFWIDGDPQPGTSKQDSAIRLAQLYRLANKYDLENMKDIVIDKLPLYTNIWHPEQWLAVAEIIYAVIPNSDEKYPKILRSLITRYLEIKGAQGVNGLNGAMLDCIAKGGRLATDISRGSRKFWARRVREISMIGGGFRRGAPYPDMNLNDEESYDDDIISGKKF